MCTRPDFFHLSSCIKVDLPLYEIKTTDKREQYDWMVEKNWTGKEVDLVGYIFDENILQHIQEID